MKITSLGHRTDLIFSKFGGVITNRGSYLVIETKSNPDFYWGNYLLFEYGPQKGDLQKWKRLFQSELCDPRIKHIALAWDAPMCDPSVLQEFLGDGFSDNTQVVLTAQQTQPNQNFNPSLVVRPLHNSTEWNAAFENQIAARPDEYPEREFRPFKEQQFNQYRKMYEAGMGHWFGGFLNDRLVADLGIFKDGEVGRFQNVGTHPDVRRQGLCGTLVYKASQFGFREMGIKTLVMAADESGHARRVYESVGFRESELQYSVAKW